MMKVNACVIHELIKDPKNEEAGKGKFATFDLSEELLNTDNEFVKALLAVIHRSFGDDSALRNTHFETDRETVFSKKIEEYILKETIDFLNFTTITIKDLKFYIDKENFATGGYYVFGDYSIEGRRFISVMVVRKNSNAINFKKVGKAHRPTKAENINTEKIAMGFRLNYGLYLQATSDESIIDNERNYIALLAGQQERSLSGYFKEWVNAAGIISNVKNSATFIEIINNIDLPVDDKGKVISREEFKRRVHNYAEEASRKIIDIHSFSEYFYREKSKVSDFANKNGYILDPEFKRASQVFKKLVTIRAKIPGVELNVDYDKLNSNYVDVQREKIVIKSKELIEQINSQR